MRRTGLLLASLLLPAGVAAQRTLTVDIGTRLSFNQIAVNVMFFLASSITAIGIALFLVGAFMLVFSHGKDDYIQKGKDLMIGSMLGIVVVMSAVAIVRTVYFFVYMQ